MFGNVIKRWCMVALSGVVFLVELLFCIITVLFKTISIAFAKLTIAGSQITESLRTIIEKLFKKADAYCQ